MTSPRSGLDAIIPFLVLNMSHLLIVTLPFCLSMIFSENRYPPPIKSGAGFFRDHALVR